MNHATFHVITDLYKNGIKRKKEDQDSNPETNEDDRLKKKKVRTTFTGRQIFELEKMFETKKYLSSSERTELAKMLNVTEQQVNNHETYFLVVWGEIIEGSEKKICFSPTFFPFGRRQMVFSLGCRY